MSTTEDVIRNTLRRCERVALGAEELLPRLRPIFENAPPDLAMLELDDRTAAVAYLKRFEQLQDLLARLARAFLAWEGIDSRELSARDVGDWLEKLRVISDASAWMLAARLRNRLVHEYPVEEEEQVARLLETSRMMPVLLGWLQALRNHLITRSFPL